MKITALFLSLVLLTLACFADSLENNAIKLNLHRQTHSHFQLSKEIFGNRRYFSKRMKHSKCISLKTNKIPNQYREDIILDWNYAYLANISIGIPAQNFTVLVSTGGSQFMVPSEKCETLACRNHRRYDSTTSRTYKKDGTPFVDDDFSGVVSVDTVCINDICAENQPFGEATFESLMFSQNTWDGELGLGFVEDDQLRIPHFFSRLFEQKQISKSIFGVWLSKSHGELSLGGVDKQRFSGNITFHPVFPYSTTGRWMFKIDEVTVGCLSKPMMKTTDAIGFTEVNWNEIWGPKEQTNAIFMSIEHFEKDENIFTTYYIANCTKEIVDSLPDISFNLNGQSYGLSGKEYVDADYERHYCLAQIIGINGKYWIMGPPFTLKYYMAFDLGENRIGFANIKK